MGCILIGTLLAAAMVFLGIIAPKNNKLATVVYLVFFSVLAVVIIGMLMVNIINEVNERGLLIFELFLFVVLFFLLLVGHKQISKRAAFFIVAGFSVGLSVLLSFIALSGYEENFEVEYTTELSNITLDDSNDFYIYETKEAYYYYERGSYKPINLVKVENEVQIIEQSDCEKAKLEKQRFNAKKSFWTFGTEYKIEYVFYVPEGTVVRNE